MAANGWTRPADSISVSCSTVSTRAASCWGVRLGSTREACGAAAAVQGTHQVSSSSSSALSTSCVID